MRCFKSFQCGQELLYLLLTTNEKDRDHTNVYTLENCDKNKLQVTVILQIIES